MTVGILLAAGGSTRLGRPKQSLPWGISTLLGHALQQLHEAGCEDIVVVLGGDADEVERECQSLSHPKLLNANLVLLHNKDWEQGQATSLRAGLQHAAKLFPSRNLLIALCDQPLIPITHYAQLVQTLDGSQLMATATLYPQGAGVPACLRPAAVQPLLTVAGDNGAKGWLRQLKSDQLASIACEEAAFDIDTPEGYAAAQLARRRVDEF